MKTFKRLLKFYFSLCKMYHGHLALCSLVGSIKNVLQYIKEKGGLAVQLSSLNLALTYYKNDEKNNTHKDKCKKNCRSRTGRYVNENKQLKIVL